ncbi:hypothetical protein U1Q18_014492 [Sarracenia purpurea var. burkii]
MGGCEKESEGKRVEVDPFGVQGEWTVVENALESVERLTRVSKKQKGSVCEGFLKGGACDGILKRDPSLISEDDLDAQIALADIRQDAAQLGLTF